jgi:GT2 family glycosyltransferase/glycosyltransferase involved in cell wall biosynthesis
VAGNPLQAPVVARWLLNVPGHLGGDTVYERDDLIYYYANWCLPKDINGMLLELPTVDTSIFNNENNPEDTRRSGGCYYAHKYLAFGGKILSDHLGLTSLCHDIPRSPEEIASLLRRSEVLYCYEQSAIIQEALACGCPVLLVPTEYWRIDAGDPHLLEPGVALAEGSGSVLRARATLGDSVVRLEAKQRTAWHQISRFIEQTQSRSQWVRRKGRQESADYVKGFLGMTKAKMPVYAKDALADKLKSRSEVSSAEVKYTLWKAAHPIEGVPLAMLDRVLERSASLPLFQFVVPLLDGQIGSLTRTLESIAQQSSSRWTVSILSRDTAPPGFTDTDELRWLTISESGFCGAFNRVIRDGGFDWFAVLAAGDCLAPHALPAMAECIAQHPDWAVVYPDEDNLGETGEGERPYFKPDFSIYALRSAPYSLGAGLMFRCDLLKRLSGVNEAFEGIELFDLALRAYEIAGPQGFGHVADVLYHRSAQGGYGTLSQDEIIALRHKALVEHFERLKLPADVEPSVLPGTFRIRYRHDAEATVSIIIPTLNGGSFLQRCIGAVVENTDYKNWELIVVDQESDDPDTLKYLGFLGRMDGDAVRIVKQPRTVGLPSLINAGVREARGRYLLFMSDASAPLRRDWLDEMLGYAVQADVGAVGAKMIGPDSNVSFAGYILGLEGKPAGLHDLHATPEALGYFGGLQVPGTPSAVSATCMLTERALFDGLGGFDEQSLAGGYSDVDYCLKVGKAGLAVVWTPFALLLQEHMFEPSRAVVNGGGMEEMATGQRVWDIPAPEAQVMFDRWRDRIAFDPAYNRNLSLVSGAFEIETIPALTWDPEFRPAPRILGLTGDRTGSGEYRVIAPMRALANAGRIQGFDTSEYLSVPELARMSPDVVIFQRQVKPHQIQLLELYRRNSNAFQVFELDDLMTNIQLGNQARQGYLDKDLVKRFRLALDMCDRFVVSTDYLAQEFRKFKSEIRVAQNCIERAKWGGFAPKRRLGRKPRVGWAGSVTHEADLAIVADVVKALADEVEWVFFGLCPEGVRKQVEYHAGVPIDDYPAKLASLNLDLAIAPLEDVPFNHGKSHLRLLEYGVLGYPVICTDITPYRGAYPVTRVKNRFKDWVEAIRAHVTDMDELARQGDALRDHINANWMLEDNLDSWLGAWLPA